VNSLRHLALVLALSVGLPAKAQDSPAPLAWFRVSEKRETPPPPPCAMCEVLSQQLEQGCTIAAGSPYADTAYLRRAVVPPLSEDLRRDISIARLSGDAAYATEILAPALTAPEAEARYAAALTVATLSIQSMGRFDSDGARTLDIMQQAAAEGPLSVPSSDYHFLRALQAQAQGETNRLRTEVKAAIAAEPRFFAAMILSLDLAVDKAATQGGQGAALCNASYGALMLDAARILNLAPCRYHAAHLELYLKRQFETPASVPALSAVQVYLSLIARRPDAAAAARADFAAADRLDCKSTVLGDLDEMIESYDAPHSEAAE
jgi:hypothetical protein